MTLIATPLRCGICNGSPSRQRKINTLLAADKSAYIIERELKAGGEPVKAETVAKHLRVCLSGKRPDTALVTDTIMGRSEGASDDFANLVRQEAVKLLNDGKLRITTKDGLIAQGLIDKRLEKAADRDLWLNVAKLMSSTQAPPEVIISTDYRVIEEESPTVALLD